jgi:hypothetical protein
MHFIRVPAPEGAHLLNVNQIIRIELKTRTPATATVFMSDGASIDVTGKSAEELEKLLTSSGMVPYGVK